MLSAVIFDFDGVIVDSEPLHCAAFLEVLSPRGITFTWEEYLEAYVGYDDREALQAAYASRGREIDVDELLELIDAKAEAFERLVAERGAVPYPGVRAFIRGLADRLPLGLCSGALARDIEPILRALGLDRSFGATVTADEVAASKPDPESYRRIVDKLQVRYPEVPITPGQCLAIEDTPAGIRAARGAGVPVLAVTNSYPAARLAEASRVVDSLDGMALEDLERCLD